MIPQDLSEDVQVLRSRGLTITLQEDAGRIFLVFEAYPLPVGIFNLERTDLLVFTTPDYPSAGCDMFWVDEGLTLRGGSIPKGAEAVETYLGRRWRRFSYHPYNTKAWNPSEDSIVTFLGYVDQRLRRGD